MLCVIAQYIVLLRYHSVLLVLLGSLGSGYCGLNTKDDFLIFFLSVETFQSQASSSLQCWFIVLSCQ